MCSSGYVHVCINAKRYVYFIILKVSAYHCTNISRNPFTKYIKQALISKWNIYPKMDVAYNMQVQKMDFRSSIWKENQM